MAAQTGISKNGRPNWNFRKWQHLPAPDQQVLPSSRVQKTAPETPCHSLVSHQLHTSAACHPRPACFRSHSIDQYVQIQQSPAAVVLLSPALHKRTGVLTSPALQTSCLPTSFKFAAVHTYARAHVLCPPCIELTSMSPVYTGRL